VAYAMKMIDAQAAAVISFKILILPMLDLCTTAEFSSRELVA
jgi:hypothetical protein